MLGRTFRYCSAIFCNFEPNYTAVFNLRRLPYYQTIHDSINLWVYSLRLLWLKGEPDRKLFYILYSTRQNLISSNSFSLNHGSNVWLFLWFNRSVQKCLRNSDYYIFILPCFFLAAKSQYISWILLNVWTYLLWFTGGLSQKSSGSSSVHKVYCEFRVWLFDNNTFRQDSIFVTTGFPIVISIYVPSTPSL